MFHTIFYAPLYNALILLTGWLNGSLGWAIIVLTLAVKIILIPLSYQSTISQIEQKKLAPFVNEIKKKYPDQKVQAEKLNELYKEHKTHPLSGCVLLLVQLPVLLAIFYVFKQGAVIDTTSLYSFVQAPALLSTKLFGIIDIAEPNVVLLIITAFAQYLQMAYSPSMQNNPSDSDATDTQAAMANTMQKTMKYIIPVMIIVGGWKLPAAILIYWILSSLFMLVQERVTLRILAKKGFI